MTHSSSVLFGANSDARRSLEEPGHRDLLSGATEVLTFSDGTLNVARIEDLGTRAEIDEGRAHAVRDKRLAALVCAGQQR
jgi:hypothetical protein